MEVRISRPLLLIGIIISTLSGCTGFFYQPETDHVLDPFELNLAHENVRITSGGINLHGWFLPADGQARGTVMFLHGNAENVSTHIGAVFWLPGCGYNVFLFDYRGYGRSEGSPDIDGVHADVEAAFRYLQRREDVDPEKIIVYGHSLGASMALYLAAEGSLKGQTQAIIAEAPFSGYRAIAREKVDEIWLLAWLQHPISWFIVDSYSPLPRVDKIAPTPVLYVHGDRDPIVPIGHSWALLKQSREPKEIWKVESSDHFSNFTKRRDLRVRLVNYMDIILGQGLQEHACYF